MADILEVITTRRTLWMWHPFITASVPSTAGLINSISSFGSASGQGDAMCITYVAPYMALITESAFSRSASTSVRFANKGPKAFFKGAILLAFERSLTVPRTSKPPSLKSKLVTWEPSQPVTPVMRTTGFDLFSVILWAICSIKNIFKSMNQTSYEKC